MRFIALLSVLGLGLAEAASIQQAKQLVPRQNKETQQEYDQETTSFKDQGLCRAYIGAKSKSSLDTCIKCGDLVKQANESGNATSVSCVSAGQTLEKYTDPDGDQFTMGECECNIPILDEIVMDVVMSLPAIAQIGCEILFKSLDLVLQIGAAAIPGEGAAMDAGMASAVKAAKTITENGQDASSFIQWIANPCGSSNYTAMIDKIFDPLSAVPDSVMPGLGCKNKKCPGKPKESGAKGSPDESAPATKASDTAKPTSATDGAGSTTAAPSKTSDAASNTSKASGDASVPASKASTPAASATGPTSGASGAASATSNTGSSAGSTIAPSSTVTPSTTESPTPATSQTACPASSSDAPAPAGADKLRKRAPQAFCFNYAGVPPAPANSIPNRLTCINKQGTVAHYSSTMISAAIQQGARYNLGKQVVGGNKYPHEFKNTAGVDDVTVDSSCQGDTVLEFPIQASGLLVTGGRNALQDPGTDRVLFSVTNNPGQVSTKFCGMMTHNKAANQGSSLLPFGDCVAG